MYRTLLIYNKHNNNYTPTGMKCIQNGQWLVNISQWGGTVRAIFPISPRTCCIDVCCRLEGKTSAVVRSRELCCTTKLQTQQWRCRAFQAESLGCERVGSTATLQVHTWLYYTRCTDTDSHHSSPSTTTHNWVISQQTAIISITCNVTKIFKMWLQFQLPIQHICNLVILGPNYKKILRLSYDVIITYDNRKSNLR